MFFLFYITLIYVWVSEVSSRYMGGWSLSDEAIAHMVALVVLAVVARLIKGWYTHNHPRYAHRMEVRRYNRAVRSINRREKQLAKERVRLTVASFKVAGNKPLYM